MLEAKAAFFGPLPPPGLLDYYERVCPGLSSRLVEMVQTEAEHRRKMESDGLAASVEGMRRQFSETRLGQVFAFIIAMAFIFAGAFVILHGHPWPGTILGGAGLTGIVTAFLRGRGRGDSTDNHSDRSTRTGHKT